MAKGLHIRSGLSLDNFTNQFSSSYALSYDPTTGQVGYMGTGSFSSGTTTIINTGSFITTGSNGSSQSISGSLTITENLTVLGTASIQYLTVIYETASVIYSSGSNQFGDATNDRQTLIGNVYVSGSLQVTGSTSLSGGLNIGTVTYANNTPKILGLNSNNQVIYMSGADVVVFPYTGSAIMSGSLTVIGSQQVTGSLGVTGSVYIGSTATNNLLITSAGGSSYFQNQAITIQGPDGGPNAASIVLHNNTTDIIGSRIDMARSNANQNLGAGQDMGELRFWRAYGLKSFVQSAYIKASTISGSTVTSGPGALYFGTTPSGSITPQQRLVIQENGNVGIGAPTASATLHVSGANMIFDIPSKANGYVLGSDASGNATWINPNNITTATPIYIATGSVTASVNTAAGNFNMFALTSGSKTGLTYTNEGVLTLTNVSGSGLPTATINTGTGHSLVITTTGILRLGNSSANSILLNTNSTDRWYILGNGHFVATTDNTYDIGASGANRVRNIYVAGTGSFEKGLIVTGSTYLKSLSNVSTTNVLSYDTSTGQVYYLPTSSIVTAPTFPYTGNAVISGSLSVSGSGITLTGSLGINGSLKVTGGITGSFSGSVFGYVPTSQTASFATTGSNIFIGNQIVTGSLTISGSSQTLIVSGTINATNGITASLFGTASWARNSLTASYSTTLGADLGQPATNQVQLKNSAGTNIGSVATIDNVANATYAGTAYAVSGYDYATIDQINIGQASTGNYNFIVRAEELQKSKYTTINIFNNLNFI